MILQRKALIDFRNYILEKYNLRWHEFEDMPFAGQYGYYVEFFKMPTYSLNQIQNAGDYYNQKHEEESIDWKAEHKKYKMTVDSKPDGSIVIGSRNVEE